MGNVEPGEPAVQDLLQGEQTPPLQTFDQEPNSFPVYRRSNVVRLGKTMIIVLQFIDRTECISS